MKDFRNQSQKPRNLGFGLGLRAAFYEEILTLNPPVDWFEIITENYLVPGGKPLHYLDTIRQSYPMVMHGVSLSLGSSDPLDSTYLKQVYALSLRIEPAWISDHLCWTGVNGFNTHDLLPLPYTQNMVNHLVSRLHQIQDYFKRPFLIENVSSYLTYKQSEMTEWEFIHEILKKSGCYLLLDLNNLYVSSVNHGFEPMDYLQAMPSRQVVQIHLAGHSDCGDHLLDTHDAPISNPVWQLYEQAIQCYGPVATMIERDDNIPSLLELLTELEKARQIAHQSLLEEALL